MPARLLAPLGVFDVLALAAGFRFWALAQPATLVFDELYYVRDAISQLAHGFPTVWPDDDPLMQASFTDEASYAVHPPLGKWMIALGLLVFGDETGWGWRSAVAFFGVATVGVTMRLAWRVSRSLITSLIAGLLLAIDGVHIVLTRVALLDGFLAFFIALGALLMWRDHEWVVDRGRPGLGRSRMSRVLWNRPWLVAAAIAFGCAASVKWSGLYPLAFFLVLTAARDVWVRVASARALVSAHRRPAASAAASTAASASASPLSSSATSAAASTLEPLAWGRAFVQAIATGLIALPVAFATYVASWAGWIATSGGWDRHEGAWPVALWKYHVGMFDWHSTLSAPHPYQSHPLTWPLALRPTAMYEVSAGDGFVAAISPLPNLFVTWGGVAALVILAWWIVRAYLHPHAFQPVVNRIPFAAVFILTGYLSGWLPWVFTFSRSAVFQFYAVVLTPFSAIALALVLGAICAAPAKRPAFAGAAQSMQWGRTPPARLGADDLLSRRLAVAVFLAVAVLLAVLFFPVWSGMPEPQWFWRWHLWLPGWM